MTSLASKLRLEIENTAQANLITNPNGEAGTKGWWWNAVSPTTGAGSFVVDTTGVPIAVNGASFKLTPSTTTVSGIGNARQAIAGGEFVGAAATFWRPVGAPGTVTASIYVVLRHLPVGLIPGSLAARATVAVPVNTPTTLTVPAFVAPAGSDVVAIVVAVTCTTPHPVFVSKVAMNIGDTAPLAAAAWVAPTFDEVIGESMRVSYSQGNALEGVEDKIEAGLLTAVVKDATLDPAFNSQIYRGRQVRLSALVSPGVWEVQTTMKVETLNAAYDDGKTVVTVTATDSGAVLNGTQMGTCGTASLESVLGDDVAVATGLETDDGAGNTFADSNLEAVAEGSTAADWLRRACNTYGGYAWVDKAGTVQARSVANLPTTSTTFSDDYADAGSTFYTGIDVATSSEAIVNNLLVALINVAELDGVKEYGPFSARSSVRKWRIVDGRVEILAGVPMTIAAALLKIFATPAVYPRTVTFNATDDITKATSLALYQKARVKRTGLLDASFRVLKISHEITAHNDGDKWITTITTRPLETGQPAITTVPPPGGALSGPADMAAYSTRDQSGIVALGSGSGAVNSTVTFTKPFPPSVTPAVTVTPRNLELNTPRITSLSNTGFTVRWDRASSGAYGYLWQASTPTP